MESSIFCSKCGSADQSPQSYCRNCGEWLNDPNEGSGRGIFRHRTGREARIARLRMLQFASVALSLASAIIIITFLRGGMEKPGVLSVAALFAFLVAMYQVISIILGRKVLMPPAHQQAGEQPTLAAPETPYLAAADTSEFIRPDSVVDGTTELLPTAGRADVEGRKG